MGVVLMVIGGLVAVAGGVMFLALTYQKGVLWTVGCILFVPVQLIFLLMHWEEAKGSFVIQLIGTAIFALGVSLGSAQAKSMVYETLHIPFAAPAKPAPPAAEAAPPPVSERPPVAAPPPDLRTNEQRMSDECASALGMLCSGMRGEKAQLRCLRSNEDALSASCRAAVDEIH